MYEALNKQQLLVLNKIYPGVEEGSGHGRRWQSEEVLERKHCCPSCNCVHLANPERQYFERTAKAAQESGHFSRVFACWSGDNNAIALFGVVGYTALTNERIAFIDQWHVMGQKATIPSYAQKLEELREEYWSMEHVIGKVVILMLLTMGIYLAAPAFPHLLNSTATPTPGFFSGGMLFVFGIVPGCSSIWRASLIFGKVTPIT